MHCTNPSLLRRVPVDTGDKLQSGCVDILRQFQMLENIRTVAKGNSGVADVIEGASGRIKLFMSHIHCAVVQEGSIGEYIDEVRSNEPACSDVIILDFEMKFEPVRYRETSVEFYDNRCMRWHGYVNIYLPEADDPLLGPSHWKSTVQAYSRPCKC